jgi:hypothetical protein
MFLYQISDHRKYTGSPVMRMLAAGGHEPLLGGALSR